MAGFSVQVDGYEELNTISLQLKSKQGRVGAQGARVIKGSADDVEALAKLFCPVDTGKLQESIGPPVINGDGRFGEIEAVITAHKNYAYFVEFGTSRQGPAAFMGPALDRIGPDYEAAIAAIADPFDGG